jgi:hypothetical protein
MPTGKKMKKPKSYTNLTTLFALLGKMYTNLTKTERNE